MLNKVIAMLNKDIKNVLPNLLSLLAIFIGYCGNSVLFQALRTIGFFAFSGAITNWLAVHMLFEKVPFLYGSGVVPNNFNKFKDGIKNIVMEQFFSTDNLKKFMSFSSINVEAEDVYNNLISAIMDSSLSSVINMFGGEKALDSIKPKLIDKIDSIIKDKLKNSSFSPELMHDKILFVVDSRLEEMTPSMVKAVVQTMLQKHLGWIVVWGGVFGALLGLLHFVFVG